MKDNYLFLVSVLFVVIGWSIGTSQSQSPMLEAPSLEATYRSVGNPVSESLSENVCGIDADQLLAIVLTIDLKQLGSDQGIFELYSDRESVVFELLPNNFDLLQLRFVTEEQTSAVRVGQQSWLGNRQFIFLLGNQGEVKATGIDIRRTESVLASVNSCPSLIVGGARDRGDFQGDVSISLGKVSTQIREESFLAENRSPQVLSLAQYVFLYDGATGVFVSCLKASRSKDQKRLGSY
jgi:hypothetical protein